MVSGLARRNSGDRGLGAERGSGAAGNGVRRGKVRRDQQLVAARSLVARPVRRRLQVVGAGRRMP